MTDRHNPENVPTDKDVMYGKGWPKGPVAFPELNLQSLKVGDKWIISWKLTKTNSCNIK
jgi:hypothetical protein